MSTWRTCGLMVGLLLLNGACGKTWGEVFGTEEPEGQPAPEDAPNQGEAVANDTDEAQPAYEAPPGEGLPCGDVRCSGDTPLCAKEDETWGCVGEDSPAMFKNACLTAADCGDGQQCCAGMTTRCVAEGECGGGDTPLVACATMDDCPEMTYGMKVKGCLPSEGGQPGLKVCQIN